MSATQIALPFLASALTLSLGFYALHYRHRHGGVALAVFLFVLAVCGFANGLEALLPELSQKLLARHVATTIFWGYCVLVLWLLLSIMPSRQSGAVARYLWLMVPLAIASLLTWTNAWHGWMWIDVTVYESQLVKEFAPLGLALRWYTLTLLAVTVILGFLHSRRLPEAWRRHVRWILVGISMPLWLAATKMAMPSQHVLQTFPTSIAFIPASVFILVALWQHQLLGYGAVARDRLFHILPDGLLVIDEHCRVLDINRTLHALFRLPGSVVHYRARHLLKRYPAWYEAVREQREESCLIRIAGRDYEVTVRRVDNQGRTNTLSTVRDVTETQSLLHRLEQQSQRDSLTGAFNRRAMISFYEQLGQGGSVSLGMLVIDLDDFKQVNDRFGHQVGDDALVKAVRIIQRQLRPDDLFCRMGGEEFVVVMSDLPKATLNERAEVIREAISKHLTVAEAYSVTASIGLAYSPVIVPFEALFRVADERLYCSKNAGKNQVYSGKAGENATTMGPSQRFSIQGASE